jgi:hypothetical protein
VNGLVVCVPVTQRLPCGCRRGKACAGCGLVTRRRPWRCVLGIVQCNCSFFLMLKQLLAMWHLPPCRSRCMQKGTYAATLTLCCCSKLHLPGCALSGDHTMPSMVCCAAPVQPWCWLTVTRLVYLPGHCEGCCLHVLCDLQGRCRGGTGQQSNREEPQGLDQCAQGAEAACRLEAVEEGAACELCRVRSGSCSFLLVQTVALPASL